MAGSGTAHLRAGNALLRAEHLVVNFRTAGRTVHAVSDVSLDVLEGETLGLVGESGCGKSTTGRALMQLPRPTSGTVTFDGQDLTALSGKELRRVRSKMQLIFQDPISSLNPRRSLRDIVAEPLCIWHVDVSKRNTKIREVFDAVGLDLDAMGDRQPHQFSGGQCQRASVARALVLDPRLLICDEPVSALDVSVQAQILNLLEDTKARYGISLIFISHDLAVVKNVSDRVAVMYLGKLCEVADAETVYRSPAHPYTKVLIQSIPEPDPTAVAPGDAGGSSGEMPSAADPPSGCRFRTRCPIARDICAREEPVINEVGPGHFAACHFASAAPDGRSSPSSKQVEAAASG